MKHEKKDTMIILFVEPTDERARVIRWLVQLQAQQTPIVVVLPQDAVFRRPGDLRELQQAIVPGNLQLILVIEGNERLRLWARHQGFTVFSATETCFKALSQWGKSLPPLERSDLDVTKPYHKPAVIEQLSTNRHPGSPGVVSSGIDTRGEMYRPSEGTVVALTADRSRKTTGYFTPGVYQDVCLRDTEPLMKFALHEPIAYQQTMLFDWPYAPSSLYAESAPDVFPGKPTPPVTEQMAVNTWQSSFVAHWHALWRDRLLLLLIGLVVLGAVGGVGLEYFLR